MAAGWFIAAATLIAGGAGLVIAALAVGTERAFARARSSKASGGSGGGWRKTIADHQAWLEMDRQRRRAWQQAQREWSTAGADPATRPKQPPAMVRFGMWARRAWAQVMVSADHVANTVGQFRDGFRDGWTVANDVRLDGGSFRDIAGARPPAPVSMEPVVTSPPGPSPATTPSREADTPTTAPEQASNAASASEPAAAPPEAAPATVRTASKDASRGADSKCQLCGRATNVLSADGRCVFCNRCRCRGGWKMDGRDECRSCAACVCGSRLKLHGRERCENCERCRTCRDRLSMLGHSECSRCAICPCCQKRYKDDSRRFCPPCLTRECPCSRIGRPPVVHIHLDGVTTSANTGTSAGEPEASNSRDAKDAGAENPNPVPQKEDHVTAPTTTAPSQGETNLDLTDNDLANIHRELDAVNEQVDALAQRRTNLEQMVQRAKERIESTGGTDATTKALDAASAVVTALGQHLGNFSASVTEAGDVTNAAKAGLAPARDAQDALQASGARGEFVDRATSD